MKILTNKEYEKINNDYEEAIDNLKISDSQYRHLQKRCSDLEVDNFKLNRRILKIKNSFDPKLLKKLKEYIDSELNYHILPTNELIDLINLYRDILNDRSNI